MLILGLGGLGYRDSSAALVRDGRVVAAAAEERFTRVKHQGGYPKQAIAWCLASTGVTLADVEHVAIANNPWISLREKVLEWHGRQFFESPEFRAFHIFHDELHATLVYLESLEALRAGRKGRFHVVRHHIAHMASSFFTSPHTNAALLDMDGRGELSTSGLGVGRGTEMEVFRSDSMPNSLGLLYAAVSDFLGFTGSDDEFRVMSIATSGRPSQLEQFRRVVHLVDEGGFQLDPAYFTYRDGLAALSAKFVQEFGGRRERDDPLLERHRDIAASLQRVTEETVLHAAKHLRDRTGERTLCFSGGVALNWVVNGCLANDGPFDNVYVNPLAGDEGTAVGAALYAYVQETGLRPEPLRSMALGPATSDAEIEETLRRTRQQYERVADPVEVAAERLARGEIVGWYQGRLEFGPRGLGARGILADPANLEVKARLLRDVKRREEHHPFALSITSESSSELFPEGAESPFLLLWHPAKPERHNEIRSVLTREGHVRWQGVDADTEPLFHRLLLAFGRRTGRLPALLNTSLNQPGRPPARTPSEALELFATTGLDALLVGPFLVEKRGPVEKRGLVEKPGAVDKPGTGEK